jgi:hypothetical protein
MKHAARVIAVLEKTGGNVAVAAKHLGINERTLRRWLATDEHLMAAHQRILAKLAHSLPSSAPPAR